MKDYSESAWYVLGKDLERNVLVVGQGNENNDLYSRKLTAAQPKWINAEAPELPLHCSAKIRYRQSDQSCAVKQLPNNQIEVCFDDPQRAVTPGQYVVFYQGDRCLGGAIIEEHLR